MRNIFKYRLLFFCVVWVVGLCSCKEQNISVMPLSSPDSTMNVSFRLSTDGRPLYDFYFNGQQVIQESALGLEARGVGLASGFELVESVRQTVDEWWHPVWGENTSVRNHFNELKVKLASKVQPGWKLNIVLRAFNDGIAFRYEIDGPQDSLYITDEASSYQLAGDPVVWWLPADYNDYEYLYTQSGMEQMADSVNTPLTMKVSDSIYLSFHEAALYDYPGLTLKKSGQQQLKVDLVPWPDGIKAKIQLPFKTPWRTIRVADKASGLWGSEMALNLNEPCKIDDTSWIQPMKYVGIWWGMHLGAMTWGQGDRHGATTENAKAYIDFAASNGIDGVLIEGWNVGWEQWGQEDNFDFFTPYSDFDLEEVTDYARANGVEVIGHHETGGNVPLYERKIDSAFALYHKLGIRAVKTGYAGNIRPEGHYKHGQKMVQHYQMVLEKAAKYRIMLNVHEPIHLTGISRTYPNLMTAEGAQGMEFNAWSAGNPPAHTLILPFTRLLAGPMDYTPGIFDVTFEDSKNIRTKWRKGLSDSLYQKLRVHTTLAKQLALMVTMYSPLQLAADLPQNYEGHPAFSFVKELSADWAETRVINAEIGEYLTLARKDKRGRWFLGSITNADQRIIQVPLDFLEEDKTYEAVIYADDETADWEHNPKAYRISRKNVTGKDVLQINLARGGGQTIVFNSL